MVTITASRNETPLQNVTRVTIAEIEEEDGPVQMWLFYHGKDLAKSFRPHKLWTEHKAEIVKHLRKKGIVVEGA